MSIAVVTRAETPRVRSLATRLAEVEGPALREVVVVAEDEAVHEPTARAPEGPYRLVAVPRGRGIAYNRNRALEAASGHVIVFIDDDCVPAEGWLRELLAPLKDASVSAVMGEVRIPGSTFIGDSISALGFPGGGSAGFATMFNVDASGLTDQISTLNCAVRREVFERVGGFDESMTFGSEDTELAHRIHSSGLKILFQPSAVVEHDARSGLGGFAGWFYRRGRAAYQLSRRMPAGPRISLRLASYRRILWRHRWDRKIVAIVPLLIASVLLQEAGFVREAFSRPPAGS